MYLNNELREKIKSTLEQGGVICFVTDTVWGLGCLPDSEAAVKKIYEIKKREAKKPLILMSDDIKNLKPYVKEIPPKAQDLIDKYFPGALTLVLQKSENTPNYLTSGMDTVGVRCPDNAVFKEICEIVRGGVLATTSANLSSESSAKTYAQAVENMSGKRHLGADLIIDDFGQKENGAKGLESTVLGVFGDEIKIFRQGAVVNGKW